MPQILWGLRISQYGRAIHTLRHRFGFVIENGCDAERTDHTWFRLSGKRHYDFSQSQNSRQRPAVTMPVTLAQKPAETSLFPITELERTARWEDLG